MNDALIVPDNLCNGKPGCNGEVTGGQGEAATLS